MYQQEQPAPHALYHLTKRIIDILFSLIALIITLPLVALVALSISLESKGSPFFLQTRSGKDGKPFKLIKLRSMYKKPHTHPHPKEWTQVNDNRITPTGFFIRKYHIDELPQLINVIIGQMSIVGPRPELPDLTEKFEKEHPGFKDRLAVLPGLTGLAQINGGYNIPPNIKAGFDREYIKRRSLKLDFEIMFKTIGVLLTGQDAR